MSECLFCKIVTGKIPCKKVNESELFLAFHDVQPQANTHVLVIPKAHYENLSVATQKMDEKVLGQYLQEITHVAEILGLTKSGYRTVFNTNDHGCQTVYHVHAHIIGGEQLLGNMG